MNRNEITKCTEKWKNNAKTKRTEWEGAARKSSANLTCNEFFADTFHAFFANDDNINGEYMNNKAKQGMRLPNARNKQFIDSVRAHTRQKRPKERRIRHS